MCLFTHRGQICTRSSARVSALFQVHPIGARELPTRSKARDSRVVQLVPMRRYCSARTHERTRRGRRRNNKRQLLACIFFRRRRVGRRELGGWPAGQRFLFILNCRVLLSRLAGPVSRRPLAQGAFWHPCTSLGRQSPISLPSVCSPPSINDRSVCRAVSLSRNFREP